MAKLVPAFPCGVRQHDAALEPGDMSPRPFAPPGSLRPQSNQIKPSAISIPALPPRSPKSENRSPIPRPQSRQKPLQSRLIVPHQASSSQTPNSRTAPVPGAATTEPAGLTAMPKPSAPRPEIREPGAETRFSPIKPQSRQKTQQSCLIKAHQGKRPKSPFAFFAYFAVNLPCLPEIRDPRPKPDFCPFATLRLRAFALKTRYQGTIKLQSRQIPQQSRLIVPYQGKP